MRILGFDLGARRVGVAVWDDPELPARPLETVAVTRETLVARVLAVVAREAPAEVVVGLPLQLDGRESVASRAARRVAAEIAKRAGVKVSLVDERLTTTEAQRRRALAGRKGREGIDAEAAAILLQGHVDATRKG